MNVTLLLLFQTSQIENITQVFCAVVQYFSNESLFTAGKGEYFQKTYNLEHAANGVSIQVKENDRDIDN